MCRVRAQAKAPAKPKAEKKVRGARSAGCREGLLPLKRHSGDIICQLALPSLGGSYDRKCTC